MRLISDNPIHPQPDGIAQSQIGLGVDGDKRRLLPTERHYSESNFLQSVQANEGHTELYC